MKFRLGMNYWPSSSAMRWWRNFDAEEVDRDFARLRAAGCDSVRIFLLWEDFQPTPDLVSRRALDNLVKVADLAESNQLSLIPTLFTGHMSGVNWFPAWAIEPSPMPGRFRIVSGDAVVAAEPRNWYADELILEAQALQAREVAAALRDHAAVWAYDLGNENSNCVIPPTRAAGISWLRRLTDEIRSADPNHQITIGLHGEDLEEDRLIGPREAALVCDFLCMHGYPMYLSWARDPTDELVLPFLGELTRWMGSRDVLFEEFGAPTIPRQGSPPPAGSSVTLLTEEAAASYTARSLKQLLRFGFIGAMLWCHADYVEALWTQPPFDEAVHERHFGFWGASGAAKSALIELSAFAASDRQPTRRTPDWIDISVDQFYEDPPVHLRRLYAAFLRAVETNATVK